jgi:hypothetical protein
MATKRIARQPIRDSAFWRKYYASRYAILFYVLLLTLVAMPIATTIGLPSLLVKLLIGVSLCAAVMPNATKRTRVTFFVAVLLVVAARIVSESDAVPVNAALLVALVGFVGLLAAAKSLEFAVSAETVNSETIYAALDTYLLAGIFFGQIYWAVERLSPGSLVGPDSTTEATALYYSFVTLATLGYGDFVPRHDIIRGLAVIEVIGGQLFLAVMVARLIGMFVPKGRG